MSDIGVFSFGRKQSERCPNKMLRPFGGTTLADIALEKLAAFAPGSFFAAFDEEFRDKSARHGVPFVQRDARSVSIDEPITEILSFLRDVPYTHLLIVNGCLPFLRTETIAGFLDDCRRGGLAPAFAVNRRQNHFMSLDHQPLNFPLDMRTINSKTVRPVLEFAHALYFFEKSYFFEHGRYWDWQTVRLIEAGTPWEMLDIDTEQDFAFAEAAWKGSR
jgi:molybdopterin-guanine dinucleotide biosynthesis protein A